MSRDRRILRRRPIDLQSHLQMRESHEACDRSWQIEPLGWESQCDGAVRASTELPHERRIQYPISRVSIATGMVVDRCSDSDHEYRYQQRKILSHENILFGAANAY